MYCGIAIKHRKNAFLFNHNYSLCCCCSLSLGPCFVALQQLQCHKVSQNGFCGKPNADPKPSVEPGHNPLLGVQVENRKHSGRRKQPCSKNTKSPTTQSHSRERPKTSLSYFSQKSWRTHCNETKTNLIRPEQQKQQ